jgi:hypothetical protein
MLTLSPPAAPRFRLTARKACRIRREVILPVSECTLILLMVSLSRSATRKFGPAGLGGCFLAFPPFGEVPWVSRQESGRANFGLQPESQRSSWTCSSFSLFHRFSLSHSRAGGHATPGLLLPLKRRRLRRPSPHHRIAYAVSPVAYRRDLPTVGRRRASPVMVQDHFLQAATRITVMV